LRRQGVLDDKNVDDGSTTVVGQMYAEVYRRVAQLASSPLETCEDFVPELQGHESAI
jgi:hypothetical protein